MCGAGEGRGWRQADTSRLHPHMVRSSAVARPPALHRFCIFAPSAPCSCPLLQNPPSPDPSLFCSATAILHPIPHAPPATSGSSPRAPSRLARSIRASSVAW